jgi:hypothetical protein
LQVGKRAGLDADTTILWAQIKTLAGTRETQGYNARHTWPAL